MLEGDIILTPKLRRYLDDQKSGKSISPFDAAVRKAWPGARIPYTFARGFGKLEIHYLLYLKILNLPKNISV